MTIVQHEDAGYRDPARTPAERAQDLLERMTAEEKAAQLGSVWGFQVEGGAGRELLAQGLGQVTRLSGSTSLTPAAAAAQANEVQRFLVEQTRLGIPAIVHEEICSGLMARDSMAYAQAIGLASTWQPELVEAMAARVRDQMRASGSHQGLSPVLDVCRDARWGRLEETFGEDPYLVARMGTAFVRGLQGASPADGVIATAKHFVGYGASEGGMNWAPVHLGPRELREVYLHPFEAVVRTTGLRSLMNAYHELDGVPCGGDRELLTDLLREQWGFDGMVVSDYFSVRQLAEYHRLATSAEEAAAMALAAGMDVELPNTDCYGSPLLAAVEAGLVGEDVLDDAVRRVLRAKIELGLFERPYVEPERASAVAADPAQGELARTIARQSLVLLRNDGTLPLAPGRTVALIGPNADSVRHLFGDYTYPAHVESLLEMARSGRNVFDMPIPENGLETATLQAPTVLDGLRERLGERVAFAAGCEVSGESRDGFEEAVALAARSDVAVLVLGDRAGLTDDCTSGESRDRSSLDLPGVQEELARAVIETGTPTVLVLVVGRPCGSAWLHERCAAVLLAWLPGEEGGPAVAEALTGEHNPGGKLPISFPHDVGQVPVFYGHKVSGGRSHWKGDYVDGPSTPLHPFGHGLSYTTFGLDSARLRRTAVRWDEAVEVDVELRNTGARAGDEVVQLYVRDSQASVTRPVLELKAFRRVSLEPGAGCRISFTVPAAQLGFYDRALRYVVEPGTIDVFVGTSSRELVDAGTVTVEAGEAPVEKAFDGAVEVTPL